ncbi:Uma2 family endonuclease [Kitasatospora sp. NPDC089913]|uniref:Uma2 family endonuclease n=1 Tax=Kitasatospora sp. NPDC089913 TaxID=3364080 RepID=UPI00381DF3FD
MEDLSEQYPVWLRPPIEGHTADSLDRLPDLPPHTELLFGGLVFSAPQTRFHARTVGDLDRHLDEQVPEGWEVWCRMGLKLDHRNRPEPDVMVVDLAADTGPDQTFCHAKDVLLVVEVVSQESGERDREVKPRKYAAAGIPHFWRVECDEGRPVVHTYEIDPATGLYGLTGIHHKQLKVDRPFPVDIDLT